MSARVKLTGMNDAGPVWVWAEHVTSVFVRATGSEDDRKLITCVTVAGGRWPIGVVESPERVLELIDDAAAGLLA